MDIPITAFDICGYDDDRIRLDIVEVYGFPQDTSFRGGYDIRCRLLIKSGIYRLETDRCFSSTGALYRLYTGLQKCYSALNGECGYDVYCAENDLTFSVAFSQGRVTVAGEYRHDQAKRDKLIFEFFSDQSYFAKVLSDLKKIIDLFGDNRGLKR